MFDIEKETIVLTSNDKEKAKMLEDAGFKCFCFSSLFKEYKLLSNPNITGREFALKLSDKRAVDVGNVYPNFYVVSVVQTIECDGKILKHPQNVEDLVSDFRTLNGKEYTVYTATTIRKNLKKRWQDIKATRLTRKKMTEEQIHSLISEMKDSAFGVLGAVPLDKYPDVVEEKNIDPVVIDGFPVKDIIHFFNTLRK